MSDNPTILRAVDHEGSEVKVFPCSPPTFGWTFLNFKQHSYDYGWGCSEAEAVAKAQKLLKPDASGNFPSFVVVEVK